MPRVKYEKDSEEATPSKTIDQIPLEWCFQDGVVLDLTHKNAGEEINVDDIEKALDKISYQLKPFDIVLLRTGVTDEHYGREN